MKKKSYRQLERDNERLKAGIQTEIKAFRTSAEIVLNEVIRAWARSQLLDIAASSLIRDVAYSRKTKFYAKQWVDEKLDKVHDFKGTQREFLQWLEIDDAEAVYESIEKEIASKTQDYAIKMFHLELEELKESA
jgi:hypothetical protein